MELRRVVLVFVVIVEGLYAAGVALFHGVADGSERNESKSVPALFRGLSELRVM